MTAIVIGIFLGLLFGGPFGAVFGGFLGAWINKNYLQNGPGVTGGGARFNRQRAQSAFFNATFLVMGRLAKADGRVSEDEIETASAIMRQMRLSPEQRKMAISLFNQGKQQNANIEATLHEFRQAAASSTLVPMFLEIQLQAAYADGALTQAERQVFHQICRILGVSSVAFELLHKRFLAQRAFYQQSAGGRQQQHFQRPNAAYELKQAYEILGIESNASDAEVKRAYRRLMSQHHPDKLVAKGLPKEMMEVAKKKTQEIQGAYDKIRASRKK
ncbi:co-chaperone DjlA [Endozoicomonas sp. Mp262]|uniref:co-chaperone DjlA n=1 Tax=Endozoicomonas sp. Mp262 TaxID=2919499 RepID=UPI0021DA168C